MFEIIGKITVGFFAVILVLLVGYLVFRLIRAMVLAADFIRWYIAQSKQGNPEYKIKGSVIFAWCEQVAYMWDYGSHVTITHNNGAVYKPFGK